VNNFRCGLLLPHRKYTGQLNATDLFIRVISVFIWTGVAPRVLYNRDTKHFGAFPVDFAVHCVAAICADKWMGFQNYHVVPPDDTARGCTMEDLAGWTHSAGYPVQGVEKYREWHDTATARLEAQSATDPRKKNTLPFLALLEQSLNVPPVFDVSNFHAKMLELTSYRALPEMSEAYFHQCLSYMVNSNIIEAPTGLQGLPGVGATRSPADTATE
jgi:thioester reductase-like protein